jgi:AbiV family abortive infection protein
VKKMKPIPAPTEACQGGLLAAANAEALLTAAAAASSVGSFGAAESLAVLALEEAVKARMLFAPLFALSGASIEITEQGLRALLHGPRAHLLRHVIVAGQSILLDPARTPGPLDDKELAAMNHLVTASARKERGFYVDFTADGWSTPASVNEGDWIAARAFAETYVAATATQADRASMLLTES